MQVDHDRQRDHERRPGAGSDSGTCAAWNTGSSRCATAGSPTAPSTSEQTVMPSWLTADHQRDVLHGPQRGARDAGAGLGAAARSGCGGRRPARTRRPRRRRCRAAAAGRRGGRCRRSRVVLLRASSSLVGRARRARRRPTPVDAQAVHLLDGQDREPLARARRGRSVSGTGTSARSPASGIRPSTLQHQAGDGVVVLVLGQLDAGEVLDLVGAQQPRERPACRRGAGGPGRRAGRARRRCRRRSPRRRPRG